MKVTNDPLPKVDWKSLSAENDFITLQCVVRELRGLSSRPRGKTAMRARTALRILDSGTFKVVRENDAEEADFALLHFVRADPKKRLVATLDGSLLSALEKRGLGFLTLSSDRVLISPAKQQRI